MLKIVNVKPFSIFVNLFNKNGIITNTEYITNFNNNSLRIRRDFTYLKACNISLIFMAKFVKSSPLL